MSDFWGYHLSLNVAGCRVSAVTNHDLIKDFARDLVKRIDMVPYGEPMTVRFGDGNKSGITLLQLIETSNIMCHFVDDDQHGTATVVLAGLINALKVRSTNKEEAKIVVSGAGAAGVAVGAPVAAASAACPRFAAPSAPAI